jgi:hypothetical protein
MNDLSWLLILLFSNIFVGYCMYHFGHGIGREQQKIDGRARLASMRRHPSSGIRIVKE